MSKFNEIFGDTLTEEQISEVKALFEAQVNAEVAVQLKAFNEAHEEKVKAEQEVRDAEYEAHGKSLVEQFEAHKIELEEQAGKYLTEAVQEWISENKETAADRVKLQLFESFMTGLRQLMVETGIEVPESQLDLAEAHEKIVSEKNEEIEALREHNEKLAEIATTLTKEKIFAESVVGLSEMQIEKLKPMAETLVAESGEDYKAKLLSLKEAFTKTVETQKVEGPAATEVIKEDNYKTRLRKQMGYDK